jgi:hypothetical protein
MNSIFDRRLLISILLLNFMRGSLFLLPIDVHPEPVQEVAVAKSNLCVTLHFPLKISAVNCLTNREETRRYSQNAQRKLKLRHDPKNNISLLRSSPL